MMNLKRITPCRVLALLFVSYSDSRLHRRTRQLHQHRWQCVGWCCHYRVIVLGRGTLANRCSDAKVHPGWAHHLGYSIAAVACNGSLLGLVGLACPGHPFAPQGYAREQPGPAFRCKSSLPRLKAGVRCGLSAAIRHAECGTAQCHAGPIMPIMPGRS